MTSRENKVPLLILLLSGFIDYVGIALVYPLFAYMLFDSRHNFLPEDASETMRGFWLGLLIALQPLAQFFSCPILGALSDQKGRKQLLLNTLFLGFIGYVIALLGIFYSSLMLLAFYRILVGIAGGNASIVSAVVADLSAPEEKAKNYGLLNMSFGVGFTIGPFLGGMMTSSGDTGWGLYAPFALAGLLVAINILFVYWKLPETHAPTKGYAVSWLLGLKQLKQGMFMGDLRGAFLALLIFTFGWSFFTEFIPLFLIERFSFEPKQIGYYYGYTGIFYALSAGLLIQPFLKWLGAEKLLLSSLFFSGLYVVFFLWIPNPFTMWFYLPPSQILMAFVYPTIAAVISNKVGQDIQGEALGIYQAVIAFALAMCPLFCGVLAGSNPSLSITVGGGAMMVSGIVYLFFYFYDSKRNQN